VDLSFASFAYSSPFVVEILASRFVVKEDRFTPVLKKFAQLSAAAQGIETPEEKRYRSN
jgi:hypothetical protein